MQVLAGVLALAELVGEWMKWYVMGCFKVTVEAESKEEACGYIDQVLDNISTATDSKIGWMEVSASDVAEVEGC